MEDLSVYVTGEMKVVRMDNKVVQCRKICNHPYLFQAIYYVDSALIRTCGKFELLDRILPKLHRTGHRVLIFSQMTELLDLLEELLKLLSFTYLRLDGSTKQELRQQLMYDFNKPDSPYFVFLLSTRAGGLGLNLQTADTVILYDQDWNPFADIQASSRVHRIGQHREVLVLSLTTPDTVEHKVLRVQNEKRTVEDMIIGVAIFNDESNIDDRKAVYHAVTAKDQSGGQSSVTNDYQINKMLARTDDEMETFCEMDEERDARYQREWEAAGHSGDYPRLVTYDELPEYLKVNAASLIKEEELPDTRKSRSKNQLSLLDNMTETEYTRLIEEGKDPNEHFVEVANLRKAVHKVVKHAKQILGGAFDELPTPEDLPEYYQIISHPITFNEVKSRCRLGKYESVQELCADLELMGRNAMRYNQQGSPLYQMAERVLKLCDQTMNRSSSSDLPDEATSYR
jgi:superfamily II DNA/RNA helicase